MQHRMTWLATLLAALMLIANNSLAETQESLNQQAHAQGETGICDRFAHQQERPSIGLVLSGGGARGAAHIGVLKLLEQHHIPIDCIAGTSMGAVVGGLYASGMTADEIEEQMISVDWGDMFRDRVPRELRSFQRKREDDLSLFTLKPGISSEGIKLPTGVVHGQKIEKLLTDLTLPISRIASFDQLQIPFRAVGTDLISGDAVVFAQGSLSTAIRASMAIPGVFSPVAHEGYLVVDGGMAMNLPVAVAQEMGADIIIAVDISTPLLTEKQLNSVFAVAEQLTGFLTIKNTVEQKRLLAEHDLLIVPHLEGISSADFELAAEAIEAGRLATEQALPRLVSLSEDPARVVASRQAFAGAPEPAQVISAIEIIHDTVLSDQFLKNQITIREGETLSARDVTDSINNLYGLELFQTVTYRLEDRPEGIGLIINAKQRSWGPTYLQAGLQVGGGLDDQIDFTFGGSLLFTQLNAWNGEARIALAIGEEPGIFGEWHQPLGDAGNFYLEPRLRLFERNLKVFDNNVAALEYRASEARGELLFGYRHDNWADLHVGYRRGTGRAEIFVGPSDIEPLDFERGELIFGVTTDTLDELYFPTSGSFFDLDYIVSKQSLGADSDFKQVELFAQHALSSGDFSINPYVDVQTTISGEAPIQSLYSAGGLFRLSGLQANELFGPNFAMVGVIAFREWETPFLSAYLGGSLEYGNVFEERSDISFSDGFFAGSLFAGASTGVGPVYLAYGRTEDGEDAVYIYVGNLFDR